MKKYRNVSGVPLSIDCISYTKFLRPDEVALLPISRDVRFHISLHHLMAIREEKKQKRRRRKRKKVTKSKPSFTKKKAKKSVKQKETIENKETQKDMEIN